jgi:transcription elongation factor SPT6
VDKELKEAGDAMVGEALIRPSNKSVDSLAIHWVVRPGCVKVIEVLEEDKDTEASIGNRLMIKVRHKIC